MPFVSSVRGNFGLAKRPFPTFTITTSNSSFSGGSVSTVGGFTVRTYTSVGTSSFTITPNESKNGTRASFSIEYLIIGGGGGGGSDMGGGGGAGGYRAGSVSLNAIGAFSVVVGGGGNGAPAGPDTARGSEGGQSRLFNTTSAFDITAFGGGGGGSNHAGSNNPAGGANLGLSVGSGGGGSGGGGGNLSDGTGSGYGGGRFGDASVTSPLQGYKGGGMNCGTWYPGGGGGAAAVGSCNPGTGGSGVQNSINGTNHFWAGGGGGASYSDRAGNGGAGGAGGGAGNCPAATSVSSGYNNGSVQSSCGAGQINLPGANAGANTGSGGGGGSHYSSNNFGGNGGSGIVIIRYPS